MERAEEYDGVMDGGLYEFEVSSHDHFENWSDVELEISDYQSSDYVDTSHIHVEHAEFDHADVGDMSTVQLVKEHFPQLAEEQDLVRQSWMAPSGVVIFVLIVVLLAGFRRYRRGNASHHSAKPAKKGTHKQHEDENLSFDATLEVLEATATAVVESRRGGGTYSVESNTHTVEQLASSLFDHICVDAAQFENILSDSSGSNPPAGAAHSKKADALQVISNQVNSIIDVLDVGSTEFGSSKSGKLKGTKQQSVVPNEISMHVEDRLELHAKKRVSAGLKVQFSVIKDSLMKVSAISDKKYIKDIFERLNNAATNKNVYHMVDCLVLLEEIDTRYTNKSEYRTAESVLSEIYATEDRVVREREENKFRLHQQDIINTFQALSLNGTPRDDADSFAHGSPYGSSKKFPNGSLKYSSTHSAHSTHSTHSTHSAHGNMSEPIIPGVSSAKSQGGLGCAEGVSAGYYEAATAPPVTGDHVSTPTTPQQAEPVGAGDTNDAANVPHVHTPLSPERAQPASPASPASPQQQMTLHHSNSGSLSPAGNRVPASDSGTSLLISSQWAMEALKLRRDSEAAVERALQDLRTRRDKLETQARSGARRSIEDRQKEVRKAKLFLESIKTQQETRRNAEEVAFQQSEQQLVREFERQRDLQQTTDLWVFRAVYLLAAVLYLLAYSKFDPTKGGVYALYTWITGNLRSACQFLSCDASVTSQGGLVATRYTAHATHVPTHTRDLPAILALPSGIDSVNATAIVSAYQSTYRTATQYVSTAVFDTIPSSVSDTISGGMRGTVRRLVVSSAYATGVSALSGGAGGGGAGEGTVISEVYGAGRCVGHVLVRSLPAMVLTRLLAFLGLKSVAGWIGTVLSVLCFSDILLQMALGPLLPLFIVGVVHSIVYVTVRQWSEHKLRWMVGGRNIRWFIVYVLYSLCIVLVAWAVGAV